MLRAELRLEYGEGRLELAGGLGGLPLLLVEQPEVLARVSVLLGRRGALARGPRFAETAFGLSVLAELHQHVAEVVEWHAQVQVVLAEEHHLARDHLAHQGLGLREFAGADDEVEVDLQRLQGG